MTVVAKLALAMLLAALASCTPSLFHIEGAPADTTTDAAMLETLRLNWEKAVSERINAHELRLDALEERCPPVVVPGVDYDGAGG